MLNQEFRDSKIWIDDNSRTLILEHPIKYRRIEKRISERIERPKNILLKPNLFDSPKYIMYKVNRSTLRFLITRELFHPFAFADVNFIYALLVSGAIESAREPTDKQVVRENERTKWFVAGGAGGQSGFVAYDCPRRLLYLLHSKYDIHVTRYFSRTSVFPYSWIMKLAAWCRSRYRTAPRSNSITKLSHMCTTAWEMGEMQASATSLPSLACNRICCDYYP